MLKKLIEKIKSIKTDYLSRSPRGKVGFLYLFKTKTVTEVFYEKVDFVWSIVNFIWGLIGIASMDRKYKPYWYSYSAMVAMIEFSISFLYTIWYYKDTTPINGFLATPLFGIIIPVNKSTFVKLLHFKKSF